MTKTDDGYTKEYLKKEAQMKTRDKYEGCVPEIAEALKQGLQVEAWVWDAFEDMVSLKWVTDYNAYRAYPYITIEVPYMSASLTDPRKPAKPPIEEFIGQWGYFYDDKADSPYYGILERLTGDAEYPFKRQAGNRYTFFIPAVLITDPNPATWADITYSAEDIKP